MKGRVSSSSDRHSPAAASQMVAVPGTDQQEISQQKERKEGIVVGRIPCVNFGSAIRQEDTDDDQCRAVQRPGWLKHKHQRKGQRYGDRVKDIRKQRQISELNPPQQFQC
jgi:hypothetical protein